MRCVFDTTYNRLAEGNVLAVSRPTPLSIKRMRVVVSRFDAVDPKSCLAKRADLGVRRVLH